jgi:hypothetical protein
MKGFIKLIGLLVLIPVAFVLIIALLATIIALSPFILLGWIAYQVKEYFIYRKSANCKLEEKTTPKTPNFLTLLKQANEDT